MPIRTSAEYIQSLRGRNLKVYLMGELVKEPVEHPIIRPSINAVAATFDLAESNPELATTKSNLTGKTTHRFLAVATSPQELILQNKMQRKLGQMTGTCFQRCVGMDAINAMHSVTFDIDKKYQTPYHARFLKFLGKMQEENRGRSAGSQNNKPERRAQ